MTIPKEDFLKNKNFYINEIKKGKIFIYPTDTVLWIWTIISNHDWIDKIFELKNREKKPLLIIVPSINWIEKNCILNEKSKKLIEDKLPGAYSFILKLKDKTSIYWKINNNTNSIWVRIPDNWFAEIISEIWEPFITTSVNLSWEPSITSSDKITEPIKSWVDYIIEHTGNSNWKSSTLIDLRGEEAIILRK